MFEIHNQLAMDEIREGIQSALAKRNYERALILQEELKQSIAEYEKRRRKQAAEALKAKVEQLEREREDEQIRLENAVEKQLISLRQYFASLYEQIEYRHTKASEELDRRFENTNFSVMKLSPTIRSLQRAEAFYVRNGDYRSAGQIRRQIQHETRIEVADFGTRTKATMEAARREALRPYQAEQKSFTQRLHNEMNVLIRDVDRQISTIENKYHKLYHNLTKRSENGFGGTAGVRTALHNLIRRNISEFEIELQKREWESTNEEEEQMVKEVCPRAPSPRRDRASSVRRRRNPRVGMALARASRVRQTDEI
jgi:hypothetical protein